ncbi:chromobox protein homolog 5-like [Metopolophium dirhodum]|uniref:chromobox protein homolog 5-like n=1 Tax=Metopolophium dirhodum TaxID=44670 RepID=UPI00298FDFCA|nr:chromobox protein homolog 5-like [Metopolophium dirhodum]
MFSRTREAVANIEPSGTAAEEEYSVEKVLDKRTRNNQIEYLLKWDGYNHHHNTWEPLENLDCKDLINEYEETERKRTEKVGRGGSGYKRTLSTSMVKTVGLLKGHRKIRNKKNNVIDNYDTDNDELPIMKIPERIMGATDASGQLIFLMKWRGVKELDLIPAKEANLKWPQIVIQFYEERFEI